MKKNGVPISESVSQHLVVVGAELVEVHVTQVASNTWRAYAVVLGECIVQSGRSEELALAHWKAVAQLERDGFDETHDGAQ